MRRSITGMWIVVGRFWFFVASFIPRPLAQAPATPALYKPSDVIVILGRRSAGDHGIHRRHGQSAAGAAMGIPYYRGKLSNKNVVVASPASARPIPHDHHAVHHAVQASTGAG